MTRSIVAAVLALCTHASLASAQPIVPFDANSDGVHDALARNVTTGSLEIRSGAGGALLRTFAPPQSGDQFGEAFVVVPDLDGDASPDVVVGAPGHRVNSTVRGGIYAYSLNSGALVWNFVPTAGIACCDVLAWVPDQDRDGSPDVLARRARAESPTTPEVILLSGATGEELAWRSGTVSGLAAWAHSGGLLFVPTDLDDSGAVDQSDVGLFVGWYLAGDMRADLSGDGQVNTQDLTIMIDDFGTGITTVKVLAVPPQEEPDPEGGSAAVLIGETCGCSPNPAPACADVSVAIEGCSSTAWVWDGIYGMRAQASPGGGTFTWEVVSGDVQIVDTNAESASFRVFGTTEGIARIRVTYRVTLADGTVCEACSCCDQPYGCTCGSSVDVIDWDGPFLNSPPNPVVCGDLTTLPDAVVVGAGESVAITLGGAPFGGSFAWQIVSTDPIEWPVRLLQTGQFGERAIVTPPNATTGQAVIAFGYSGGGCCPAFCRVRISWSTDADGDGIADEIENTSPCLDPNDADTDGDGFDDGQELRLGTDPCDATSRPDDTADIDRDGLRDFEETSTYGTDHTVFDSDDDGIQDFAEIKLNLDPLSIRSNGSTFDVDLEAWLSRDRDRDGIFDEFESARGLDPFDSDQDRDGVRDGLEMRRGLDPFLPDQGPGYPGPWVDSDQDYLSDDIERRMGTDPSRADTDRDGVSDGNEARMGLNPNRRDTDWDGVDDGAEDWDGDGLSNFYESARGTDPAEADSDGDGQCDRTDAQPLGETPATEYSRFTGANGATCRFVVRVQVSCGYTGVVTFGGHSVEVPLNDCGTTVDVPFEVGRWYEHSVFAMHWMGHCAHPPFDGVLCGPAGFAQCRTWLDFGLVNATPDQPCSLPPAMQQQFEVLDSYGYRCEPQPVPRQFRYRVRWVIPGAAAADTDGDGVDDTWDTNGDGIADNADRVLSVNVHIDSDNNNGFEPPDCQRGAAGEGCDPAINKEDGVEDCANLPGKIILAGTWDSDGDNIPDYADGFDLLSGTSLDDPENAGFSMIPLDVEVTGVGGMNSIRELRFTYAASDPAQVSDGTSGRPVFALPTNFATHNLRLWAFLSEEPSGPPTPDHDEASASSRGPMGGAGRPGQPGEPCWRRRTNLQGLTWIDPAETYEISRFADRPNGRIRLWLQAVGPSQAMGQQVSVSLVGDSQASDTVRVTSVDMRLEGRAWHSEEFIKVQGIAISMYPDSEEPGTLDREPLGAWMTYRYRVRDPRGMAVGPLHIGNRELPWNVEGDWLTTDEFIVLPELPSPESDPLPFEVVLVNPGLEGTRCWYNPDKEHKVVALSEAASAAERDLMDKLKTIPEHMKDVEGWAGGDWPENDSGAFGKEMHKRIALAYNNTPRWLKNYWILKSTREVISTLEAQPRGFHPLLIQQVDLMYVNEGYSPAVGEILDPDKIELVVDVKVSLNTEFSPRSSQRVGLEQATGHKPRICNTYWRWTRSGGWTVNPEVARRFRLGSAMKYGAAAVGIVMTVRAFIHMEDEYDKFRTVLRPVLVRLERENGLERNLTIATDILPAFNQYTGQYLAAFDATDIVQVLLLYESLSRE